MKNHIDKNRLKLSENAQDEINSVEEIKIQIEQIQRDLKDAIANKDAKAIFASFGMGPKEDKDGFLTIFEFKKISDDYSFGDIGINANLLFKKLKCITGNADFENSDVTDLGSLETIGGDAYFRASQVKDLGNLKTIGGTPDFRQSAITDLGNLKTIGGYADFRDTQIKSLGSLKTIGRDAIFCRSEITDLGNLETIGDKVYIDGCLLSKEDKEKLKAMQNGNSN